MNVEGKVIVITGAARGLGQEYARYLGGLGAPEQGDERAPSHVGPPPPESVYRTFSLP
jgi:hypothetical protein